MIKSVATQTPAADKEKKLFSIFSEVDRALVCFPGDASSGYLLWAAKQALGRSRVLAVTAGKGIGQQHRRGIAALAAALEMRHQWVEEASCWGCPCDFYNKVSEIAQQKSMTPVDSMIQGSPKIWKIRHPFEEAQMTSPEITYLSLKAKIPPMEAFAFRPAPMDPRIKAAETQLSLMGLRSARLRLLDSTTVELRVQPKEMYYAVAASDKVLARMRRFGFEKTVLELPSKTEEQFGKIQPAQGL